MNEEDVIRWRNLVKRLRQECEQHRIQTNIFDEEIIYPNCTVQILRNSVTGEESVGWWRNNEEGCN